MYIFSLIIFACVNIIAVTGLSLLTGYTGIFSIGHAGFMAVGGYTAVILFMNLKIPFLISVLLGGVSAVIISVLIGYPALRNKLEGDAFAIAMLGFVTVIRVTISNITPVFKGAIGISNIPMKSNVWVILAFTIILVYCMRNFVKSHYGKNCLAVQQQELAAEMVGIDLVKTRLTSLMISAFYGGVAGALFAFFATFISPMSFAEAKSNDLIAAVVLGGMCSLTGPAVAAAILVVLPEVLRFLATWRLVFYGLAFIVIMRFKPDGLFGYKEISFKWVKKLYKRIGGKKTNESGIA